MNCRCLIMITGNKNNIGALLGFLQHRLHNIVMGLIPEPTTFQLPAIDNIADQIQGFRFSRLRN